MSLIHIEKQASRFPINNFKRISLSLMLILSLLLSIEQGSAKERGADHPRVEADLQPTQLLSTDIDAPLCRFGVNVVTLLSNLDLTPLRLGWYMNYVALAEPTRPNGIEYALMIRLEQLDADTYAYSPNGAELQRAILNNLGADWFIGNEPDRRFFQDDMEPALYARAYHDLYTLIKEADPTAQIFAGNIVQPTPLRLQYLDMILESYQNQYGETLPADGWAIHNFILNEVSCEYDAANCWGAAIPPGIEADTGMVVDISQNDDFTLFTEQIVRFREWMATNGYREMPLYLSEYGVLMPNIFEPPADFPPERVNAFMNQSFDYVLNATDPRIGNPHDDNRLIQRLSWYSTGDKEFNGYLYERETPSSPYKLSTMGENFVAYTSGVSGAADLYPATLTVEPSTAMTQTDVTQASMAQRETVSLTLTATIANDGHGLAMQSATVRFYDGNPEIGANQIGTDQSISLMGCGDAQTVEVSVTNTPARTTQFYVSIDPENQIAETDESNNLLGQTRFVDENRLFLPYVYLYR